MIIKSLTRKDKQSYKQLLQYISQEAKVGKRDPLFFSHNIIGVDVDEIAQEMRANYDHRQRIREDENSLLHYVLSFHKDDEPVLSRDVLTDIVYEFVDEFSPNGMAYGALHSDQDHLHCHVVLTANEVESNQLIYKKRYLSKEQKQRPIEERGYKERTFEESKNRVRSFARERSRQYAKQRGLNKQYQEHGLYHSFDERFTTHTRDGKKRTAAELDNRVRKNGRGSKDQRNRKGRILNILATDSIQAINQAGNFQSFIKTLQSKGYQMYRTQRGTINGIMYQGKKYRFTTTLLPKDERKRFNELRKSYQRIHDQQQQRTTRSRHRNRDGWER